MTIPDIAHLAKRCNKAGLAISRYIRRHPALSPLDSDGFPLEKTHRYAQGDVVGSEDGQRLVTFDSTVGTDLDLHGVLLHECGWFNTGRWRPIPFAPASVRLESP